MTDDASTDTSKGAPGVLLDVDGTLLDSNYLHVIAWSRAFRDAGYEDVHAAQVHACIGLPSASLVERLTGGDDDRVVEGHSHHFDALQDEVTPLPGARDLLRACRGRGASVVLTTSGARSDLEWMLPLLGGEEMVTGVVTSEDVDAGKPTPHPLGAAVERYGLDPRRTVVVGDSVWDLGAATQADLPCVAVRCGGIGEPELRGAGAVSVREHPADLVEHLEDLAVALAADGGRRS